MTIENVIKKNKQRPICFYCCPQSSLKRQDSMDTDWTIILSVISKWCISSFLCEWFETNYNFESSVNQNIKVYFMRPFSSNAINGQHTKSKELWHIIYTSKRWIVLIITWILNALRFLCITPKAKTAIYYVYIFVIKECVIFLL